MRALPAAFLPSAAVREAWEREAQAQAILNEILYAQAPKVQAYFTERGLSACILKGCGYARFYDEPLSRHVGDIDIWVQAPREQTLAAIREHYSVSDILLQECKMHWAPDTAIDIHFYPCKFSNPVLNRRFRRFAKAHGTNQALFPDIAFDLVFCAVHMFRHVPRGGICFKQLVDYWYILHAATPDERNRAFWELCQLGMRRFAGELMYVMQHCLLLERGVMLCPPDKRQGACLLEEVLQYGCPEPDGRNVMSMRHVLHFLPRYPREILWTFYGKATQYAWRRLHGYHRGGTTSRPASGPPATQDD